MKGESMNFKEALQSARVVASIYDWHSAVISMQMADGNWSYNLRSVNLMGHIDLCTVDMTVGVYEDVNDYGRRKMAELK